MINYLSKFSAHLSELAELIHDLAKERVPFNLGLEHNEAFSLIKKEVTAAPILAYYNPKKLAVLQIDASCKGLGAMPLTKRKAGVLCQQSINRNPEGLHGHQTRFPSSSMGNGEIPSLLIWKPIYPRN